MAPKSNQSQLQPQSPPDDRVEMHDAKSGEDQDDGLAQGGEKPIHIDDLGCRSAGRSRQSKGRGAPDSIRVH